MGILDEDVVRVRETADIVAVISAHTQLRGSGQHWSGLCPFHGEKTASFSVNQVKGVYYCFGCQAKGDVITFVREIEHVDFQTAVESLAAKFGITLRYTERDEAQRHDSRRKLTEALAVAVDWYHERLLSAADAGPARRYLRDRGLDGDEVRKYRIGWAPDDWDTFVRSSGLSGSALIEAGLGRRSQRGTLNDFFRNRVLFPIFDPAGSPLGFGGRILPGAAERRDGRPQAKYQNTPETALYRKSKVLYGLNWAKDEAVRLDEIIICEGYTDVIGFARVGLDRAVATCGTALTDEHVNLLKRFAPRLVLAFDPDAAGQAAAERVYEWEKKHDIAVAVADLPIGQDPADLSTNDPDRLRGAVEQAKPFLGYRVERILAAADLSSPESRARAADKALEVIAEHPNQFVRDPYVVDVATRCRIDVDRLRGAVGREPAPVRKSVVAQRRRRPETASGEALRLVIADPEAVLALFDEVLFEDPEDRAAFVALRDAGGDLHAAVETGDPMVAEVLTRLAVEPSGAEVGDVRRLLLRDASLRVLADLRRDSVGSDDFAGYAAAIGWLKAEIEAVGPDAVPDPEREQGLLLWLAARGEERDG